MRYIALPLPAREIIFETIVFNISRIKAKLFTSRVIVSPVTSLMGKGSTVRVSTLRAVSGDPSQ